jgi:hypothetical protein
MSAPSNLVPPGFNAAPLNAAQATPPAALASLAERLSRTLAVSRALLLAGRPLDLRGFDDGVGMLCAQTLDLPPEESRHMVPLLHHLAASIDQLGTLFTERLRTPHARP